MRENDARTMKALVKTHKGDGFLEVQKVDVPRIANGDDVLIEVTAAGVCGTDIHIWHDEFPYWPPVVLGHEFSGIVREVGKDVTEFAPGDLVVGEPHTHYCGKCELCRAGKIQLCAHKRSPGWGMDGAFADYLVMPELFLHKVPADVDPVTAALCEPLAIAVAGVCERGRVETQDTAAVVGAGPIGLLSCIAAKASGASRVIVLGTNADEKIRFGIARKLGADAVINVQKEDAKTAVDALTDGKGANLAVEASGTAAGVNTAVDIVKKCGRIAVLGMPGKSDLTVNWLGMVHKVLDVIFSFSSSVSSWDRALSIMENTPYDLSALVTHRVNIADWARVFDDIGRGDAIKAMFVPHQKTYDVTV